MAEHYPIGPIPSLLFFAVLFIISGSHFSILCGICEKPNLKAANAAFYGHRRTISQSGTITVCMRGVCYVE